jgi:hypothetical protein
VSEHQRDVWETTGPETAYTWQPVAERLGTIDAASVAEYMWLMQRCGRLRPWYEGDASLPLGVLFRRGAAYFALTEHAVELFYSGAPNPFVEYTVDELAAFITEYRAGGAS